MRESTAWYTHAWNTTTSVRLIQAIIPRVPRLLVPAIGVVTSAVCMLSMKRERRAAARNLRRILGTGGWRLRRTVFRLFYNFSRFMVSVCDLPRHAQGLEARREQKVEEALARGRGVLVLTAHLGNWEIGTRLLSRTGVQVNVAMRVDRTNPVERWLQRARTKDAVRVLPLGSSPADILALRAALARNEIVAMQGDRATGERVLSVDLFGAPFPFPLGPFALAYGCDATLLPAFVVQEGWWRFRSEIGAPVVFPRSPDRDADLRAGAAQYAAQLERIVREHPDQWFNFYDLWTSGAA